MAVQDPSLQAGLEISVCPHTVRFLASLLPLVRALLSLFAPCTYRGKHTYLVMIIFSVMGVLDNGHVRKRELLALICKRAILILKTEYTILGNAVEI